jgi:hypothetical protein
VISKQITEDEKLIITTINSTYTSDYINKGDYILGDLINLLAQHTSNFAAKRYQPNEHPRIIAYLKTRARSAGIPLPGFMSSNAKSNYHRRLVLETPAYFSGTAKNVDLSVKRRSCSICR